ncbi:MAG: hypothetical protein ACPLRX_02800 [Candidatus Saccharicenans sp.]
MSEKDLRVNNWNILLNLASEPRRNRRLFFLVFYFLMLLVVMVGFLLVYLNLKSLSGYQDLQKNNRLLMEKKENLLGQSREINKELEKYRSLSGLVDEINSVIEKKAFSWTLFFDRLEKALPQNSFLVSITPSSTETGREFRLKVALGKREDLKELVKNLQSAGFSDLKILNEVFQDGYFQTEMNFRHGQPE